MTTILQPQIGYDRLRRTRTFRQEGFTRWQDATLCIVGAGNLGFRFAREAVLSGASVVAFDPDYAGAENAGTQFAAAGKAKVDSLVQACEAIRPGSARGVAEDIRHVGIGELAELSLLVDCSDDASLAMYLTPISNGLEQPHLRLALDGSGEMELGTVTCSHGGGGFSCRLCTYDAASMFQETARMSCPGRAPNRPPTLAGGAIGAAVAGLGLLQAQRLVTGNDLEQVLDRQMVLDLSTPQMLPLQRRRSEKCLSGHIAWELTRVRRSANRATLAELFSEARLRLDAANVVLEPFGHPLCVEATCRCGGWQAAAGTRFAMPPLCPDCGQPMEWLRAHVVTRLTHDDAKELEIDEVPLWRLGYPLRGAMFTALAPRTPPLRMVLE